MKKLVIVLILAVVFAVSPNAYADKCGVCDLAESQSWGASAPGKIIRGITNVGLSWTEIFSQPIREKNFGAVGKGLGFFFIRLAQGAGEILTFWLPPSPSEPLNQCALGDMGVTGR